MNAVLAICALVTFIAVAGGIIKLFVGREPRADAAAVPLPDSGLADVLWFFVCVSLAVTGAHSLAVVCTN